MEKLTINIPDKKSSLVRQILIGLGVTIQKQEHTNTAIYKEKLANISVWSEDDRSFLKKEKQFNKHFKRIDA